VFLADISTGPTPSWAAVITAGASVITALGGFVVAVAVLIPNLRVSRETHHLVNQGHTDSVNYQNALIRALRNSGINVPIDQSLPNGDLHNEQGGTTQGGDG
jgi:hypothetical protein